MPAASVPAGHANAALIARFYAALGRRDAAAMIACYHPKASFSDPVFPELDAAGVAAMWRMLCDRGRDLAVEASDIAADATSGHAHWVARYTYSATGRPVVNRIDAEFLFRDGLIYRHRDRFDLYRWLRQALGVKGAMLGWLPPMQRATQRQAAQALTAWRAKRTG
jgi:ketosteroid isomerase-like protein